MSSLNIPNSFVVLTKAESAKVNANFAAVASWANTAAVHVDGSTALTGLLTLASTTPTGDNHATRKAYVDASDKLRVKVIGGSQLGYTGTVDPSATQMIVQAGSTVVTLNGAGEATVTYPTPFPTGVLTVLAIDGDTAANWGVVGIHGGTNANFIVNVRQALTVATVGAFRVQWVAIGW